MDRRTRAPSARATAGYGIGPVSRLRTFLVDGPFTMVQIAYLPDITSV